MARLTLEQIAEGRRALAGTVGYDEGPFAGWARANAEALLDTAAQVAELERDLLEVRGLPGTSGRESFEDLSLRLGAARALETRKAAAAEVERLRSECRAAFAWRPLVSNGQQTANPHAFAPRDIELWFHARGVVVRAYINPNDHRDVLLDPQRLLNAPKPLWDVTLTVKAEP